MLTESLPKEESLSKEEVRNVIEDLETQETPDFKSAKAKLKIEEAQEIQTE
jgi:hypothetical protein